MPFTVTVKRFFICSFLLLTGMVLQAQSIGAPKKLADEVNGYMKPLIQEMDALIGYYAEKYPMDSLSLNGLTQYTYSSQNELLQERGVNQSGYSRKTYVNGNEAEYTQTGGDMVTRKVYDAEGRLQEERQHYTDLGNEKKETYRYETEKNTTGDTLILRRYNNGRLDRRTVTVMDSVNAKTEIWSYYFDRTKPESKIEIFVSPDKKRMLRRTYTDFSSYYSTSDYFYTSDGLLRSTADSSMYGKSEYVRYYTAKGVLEKTESIKNGKLESICLNEYDSAGHLVKESGFSGEGAPIYVCVYEYDERGNKVLYLYYYRRY